MHIKKVAITVAVILLLAAILCFAAGRQLLTSEKDLDSTTYAPARIINHEDVAYIHSFLTQNPNIVAAVNGQTWFFTHASVGGNILKGLSALNRKEPELYVFLQQASAGAPAGPLTGGTIYEYARGNPAPAEKLTIFENCLAQITAGGQLVAINKFCYIDILPCMGGETLEDNMAGAALLAQSYITSMRNLQTLYPNVVFVYTTMPLTVQNETENILRQCFNAAIRTHCENDETTFLFDIADIESYNAAGQGGISGGQVAPAAYMQSEYSSDGGHLNTRGQKRLAKGWYAIAAAIALQG